ncbi:DNA polymerase delta subunit 4 [Esox lucius]|uniref:DNA polymerase delta subunit 4 n=1 Tax=Esox lucius TaxID=8010 RepID=A0A3P8YYD6_ESOLU|nr:DNA polymerase delta subunit 4 [Esox lucius]
MTAKRAGLITDTFKVVKKAKREKREKTAPTPPQLDVEPLPLTAKEKELQELRQFDQDWQFGPCTGISRLERWERASHHGLNPPEEIREMLLSRETDPDYTHCLWSAYPL